MPSRPARPPATDSWGGAPLDIDRLRRLWKPRRDAYAKALLYEAVRIRIHRSLTWLAYAERCDASKDLDARLVGQWIALNSLYGQWDRRTGSPMAPLTMPLMPVTRPNPASMSQLATPINIPPPRAGANVCMIMIQQNPLI